MGNTCLGGGCCGSKLPQIKINVNSSCCKNNKRYVINITDDTEMEQIKQILHELHQSSIKKKISLSEINILSNNSK